eukprot:1186864-Prorocentrum_minimum.AAC.1
MLRRALNSNKLNSRAALTSSSSRNVAPPYLTTATISGAEKVHHPHARTPPPSTSRAATSRARSLVRACSHSGRSREARRGLAHRDARRRMPWPPPPWGGARPPSRARRGCRLAARQWSPAAHRWRCVAAPSAPPAPPRAPAAPPCDRHNKHARVAR